MRSLVANALVRVGRRAADRHLVLADAAVGYVALGRFLRARGLAMPPVAASREEVFDRAVAATAGRRLLYLEFGVHEGASIRYWAGRVADPTAVFVGFDSFEGLPEAWNEQAPRGHFATGGRPPEIGDPRVRFVAGWFEDTVPCFEVPAHEALVLVLDADLYSSTITVLRALRAHLVPGTLLYFDELNDRHHELRALGELLDEGGVRVEPVVAARNLRQWLFRVV